VGGAQSQEPRIAPGTRREIGLVNSLIARVLGLATGGPPPRIFTTLARHRRLFRAWLRFAGRLMPGGTLARRDTEIVILRVAHSCDCEYEWRHHERIGARAGLSKEEIERVRDGPEAAGWSAHDAALLRAVDELHRDRAISAETWEALSRDLSETQLIELCMLVGHYEMLAMTLLSIGVEPEDPAPGRRGIARLGGVAGAALAVALAAAIAAPASSRAATAPTLRSGSGLHVLSQRRLNSRLLAVSVGTAALPGPANIRILLPAGYAAHPRRHYPVLYLFPGTSGGAADWTTRGEAQASTAGVPLIVVMPDIGLNRNGGGWCTNWPNGAYRWETFHVAQLVPWVDGNLRTKPTRGERAIAGLSQGGFCSTSYAARHPDLFATVFSYSGAPDIAYGDAAIIGSTAIINATEVGLDYVPPDTFFGDRVTNEVNWAAHDPTTLAENLRATRIYLFTGNGEPGPLDTEPNGWDMTIESLVHADTRFFHDRLVELGIPSRYDSYGPGTHTWPYWARDLRQSMGPLMASFRHPARVPRAIGYESADDSYTVYGWGVRMHRTAREFSYLDGATCSRFALAGSGSATVTTPRCLQPGARYRVRLRGDHASGRLAVTASRAGRLRLEVPLGPPNPYQQYTAPAGIAGTSVYRTHVAIRGGGGGGR